MNINKYIDHTNLKSFAKQEDIKKLCVEAIKYDFASVCVNPIDISFCKSLLKDTSVKVCTVIGFPLGRNKTEIKLSETILAIKDGADEIDMVINVGYLKDNKNEYVLNEIKKIREVSKNKVLKVIIESALLTDEEIKRATKLCVEGGADFVKTCTGFTGGVAEENAVKIIKENISGNVKIKASGGIKCYKDAKKFIELGADRIGTSSGVIIMEEQNV